MNKRFVAACLGAFALLSTSTATAEEVPERDPYFAAGLGLGLYAPILPSVRLFARYSLHDISFEMRAGILVPSFWVDGLFWDAAVGPRFHVLQRESIVGFVSPRVGFWDIGPASDDDEDNGIGVNEVTDSETRKLLNPSVSLAAGADFFLGSFVVTPELEVGTVWGQRFNNMDGPVILLQLNANAGWVF